MSRTNRGTLEQAVVVVADDDDITRKVLSHHLRSHQVNVRLATDGLEAVEQAVDADLAILDLKMPRCDGLEAMRRIHQRDPGMPILMISGAGDIDDAVRAMKAGAMDFVVKPFHPQAVIRCLQESLTPKRFRLGQRRLIGESAPIEELRELIRRVAHLETTVLLTGETGTGKSLVAKIIHEAGARRDASFVSLNCAALPSDLLEDELFGHTKGAFTGASHDRPGRAEMADEGTLFMDEIGDLPLELQPKLLSFLQDKVVQRLGSNEWRTVDARLIAATNRDLARMCRERAFREDLYFRVNVLALHVPALRERGKDVALIAAELTRSMGERVGRDVKLSPAAVERLSAHTWPGNVRELQNVIERAVALSEGEEIEPADIAFDTAGGLPRATHGYPLPRQLPRNLAEVERLTILAALDECGGNRTRAARELGVSVKTLYNKLKKFAAAENPE